MRRTVEDRLILIPLCACGCRENVKWNIYRSCWNIFLKGHAAKLPEVKIKISNNNSMKRPEVLIKKSGENHHYYNKTRSKETCDKISRTKLENPCRHTSEWKKNNSDRMKSLGDKHPFRQLKVIEKNKEINSLNRKGKPLSEKHKLHISEALSSFGENHWMKSSEHRERSKRHLELVRPDMNGANHPQWKGGIAAEPYDEIWLDKEYKKDILRRDNCECQNPNCWKNTEKLCGHHINYDKKNCSLSNVITLCLSCNARANTNRSYWKDFYYKIMSQNYVTKVWL